MTRQERLRPEFVEFIPDELEEGVIYISIPYTTAAHLCACGCGTEVITPISPTDWEVTFDGENVSLSPSIGNWSFPCQSHYWIKRGRIQWSRTMTPGQIAAGRAASRRRKERYAAGLPLDEPAPPAKRNEPRVEEPVREGALTRLLRRLGFTNSR